MNRPTQKPAGESKVSVKSQTVLPRAVRDALNIQPGDMLRFRPTDGGFLLDRAPATENDDPFSAFAPNGRAPPMRRPMASSESGRYDPFDVVVVPFP